MQLVAVQPQILYIVVDKMMKNRMIKDTYLAMQLKHRKYSYILNYNLGMLSDQNNPLHEWKTRIQMTS